MNGIFYAVDASLFQDTDEDGKGDLDGLINRLDYLQELGVTCLWVLPFYRWGGRDNGYDVTDHYSVSPDLGTMRDAMVLIQEAHRRGLRVMVDLLANHTSKAHPWFRASRLTRESKYHDYYVWVDEPPPSEEQAKPIFPNVEESVWTYDDQVGQYYYHRFYREEPALNQTNRDVRDEIRHIIRFWRKLGVDGFRVDAISHVVEPKGPVKPDPDQILEELHRNATRGPEPAALMGEADVDPEKLATFFHGGRGMSLLLNFYLCESIWLALARESAAPILAALRKVPRPPRGCQWVNFLRNLDELDLERLSQEEQREVMEAFAPHEGMRLYGRGIRRRMAPMLDGERARIEMAHSLLYALPGAPLIPYGDEIGMGEDLSREGRTSVRLPMQWSSGRLAGFTNAPEDRLVRPPLMEGRFGAKEVNVEAQQTHEDSLLRWFRRLHRARKESPEVGAGELQVLDAPDPVVLLSHDSERQNLVVAHNLSAHEQALGLPTSGETILQGRADLHGSRLRLGPYGYAWIRASG